MSRYLESMIDRYPALESCRKDVEATHAAISSAFASGGKLLVCGNGGSAADSAHISAELLKGFALARPLDEEWQTRLGPGLAAKLQGSLPVIPLPAFDSLLTAFANDSDPLYGFAQLVWGLGGEGDALLCISTSGNSANILHAAEVGRAKDLLVIGLTGEGGGRLNEMADICIRVPETEVYLIQENHLPVYHCLSLMLEETFFS